MVGIICGHGGSDGRGIFVVRRPRLYSRAFAGIPLRAASPLQKSRVGSTFSRGTLLAGKSLLIKRFNLCMEDRSVAAGRIF